MVTVAPTGTSSVVAEVAARPRTSASGGREEENEARESDHAENVADDSMRRRGHNAIMAGWAATRVDGSAPATRVGVRACHENHIDTSMGTCSFSERVTSRTGSVQAVLVLDDGHTHPQGRTQYTRRFVRRRCWFLEFTRNQHLPRALERVLLGWQRPRGRAPGICERLLPPPRGRRSIVRESEPRGRPPSADTPDT